MSETKKGICISVISIVLFIVLLILLNTVDVKEVGLYGLNHTYYHEYNKALDIISDILFYLVIGLALFVFGLMVFKMIKGKNVKAVEPKFYIFAIGLVIVLVFWIIFDKGVELNYRPNAINGIKEASFPSTHILITTYIMLTFTTFFFKNEETNDEKLNKEAVITITCFIVIGLMFVFRFYAGMHWLTDCVGGILLGTFVFGLYYTAISIINSKKSLN